MALHPYARQCAALAIGHPLKQPAPQESRIKSQRFTDPRKRKKISAVVIPEPILSFTENHLPSPGLGTSGFLIRLHRVREDRKHESLLWHNEIEALLCLEVQKRSDNIFSKQS
jgi:hypothetical protein